MATVATSSRLFEGYRSLGLISSEVPALIRYIDKINKLQIVTAVGRSFLVFNEKLQLIETCVAHSTNIKVLAADSLYLFTASETELFAWKYGHKWKAKSYNGAESAITHLLVFGPQLLAVDASNTFYVWDIDSEELQMSVPFGAPEEAAFVISTMLHPATYINKVLFGSHGTGALQLWNIAKQKLIFSFTGFGSGVTKLVQAPALHIVAIGHASGLIALHHLKQDQTLMKFYQEWGPITDLSFRTDDAATKALLVSSSADNGHLAVWNLDDQRLEVAMRDLHQGPIVGAQFISKQPLLVTNSPDNSLKVYVFDDLQLSGRQLYAREGHQRPPRRIRFYGARGHYVLSGGLDASLRAFFIYSERKSRNLGTASYNRKAAKKKGVHRDTAVMPAIVELAAETTREKEWCNLVALHAGAPFATSWSFERMKMGEHRFLPERFRGVSAKQKEDPVAATALSMTACGNFVLLGYSTGHVDRFNVQSGLHRCTYGGGADKPAHSAAVKGVVADALNQLVVSGGADGRLHFWRFARGEAIGTLTVGDAVEVMALQRENSLLAVGLTGGRLLVVDLETKKVVRRLVGTRSPHFNDLAFDNDGRRLYVATAGDDCLIYVWDLLTGCLVDVFRTASPCVSLTVSPTGEFLATAHEDDLGIYLWANLSLYSVVTLAPINVKKIEEVARTIELPRVRSDEEEGVDGDDDDNDGKDEDENEGKDEEDNEENLIDYTYRSPEQLASDLITLSTLPSSRWKNLLKLDLIRKRNKPIAPPEKPKAAPFFLPTITGLSPSFSLPSSSAAEKSENAAAAATEEGRKFQLHLLSDFTRLLELAASAEEPTAREQHFQAAFAQLKAYGPSKIDAELRMLVVEGGGDQGDGSNNSSTRYLGLLLELLATVFASGRDFELAQSYLGLALQIHLEAIAGDERLLERCRRIVGHADQCWGRLEADFDRSLTLINYLRNALL